MSSSITRHKKHLIAIETVPPMQDRLPQSEREDEHIVPVPDSAIAPLDAVQRAIALANARVVALTAPRATPATDTICTMLAHNIAASGTKTLLIDAGQPNSTSVASSTWLPGDPVHDNDLLKSSTASYDRFVIRPTPSTRPLFNNLTRMQKTMQQDLRSYGAIIISLPPVLEANGKVIDPVSFARAVDCVFLVCAAGNTLASEAQSAAELLTSANVTLAGTILDSSAVNPPGSEMAAKIEKFFILPAGMRKRLARWFRTSELFNS